MLQSEVLQRLKAKFIGRLEFTMGGFEEDKNVLFVECGPKRPKLRDQVMPWKVPDSDLWEFSLLD